jgi:hypothetical protein
MVLHPKFRDFYHIAKKEGDNTFDVFYNPSGKKVTSHVLWAQLVPEGNFDTYQDAYEGVETIERRKRQEAIDQVRSIKQRIREQ